jgi:hypothetical protein
MLRLPPQDEIEKLALAFADILRTPRIKSVEPSRREIEDNDALELKRLAVDFNQSSFGRLRQLIDELSQY